MRRGRCGVTCIRIQIQPNISIDFERSIDFFIQLHSLIQQHIIRWYMHGFWAVEKLYLSLFLWHIVSSTRLAERRMPGILCKMTPKLHKIEIEIPQKQNTKMHTSADSFRSIEPEWSSSIKRCNSLIASKPRGSRNFSCSAVISTSKSDWCAISPS